MMDTGSKPHTLNSRESFNTTAKINSERTIVTFLEGGLIAQIAHKGSGRVVSGNEDWILQGTGEFGDINCGFQVLHTFVPGPEQSEPTQEQFIDTVASSVLEKLSEALPGKTFG